LTLVSKDSMLATWTGRITYFAAYSASNEAPCTLCWSSCTSCCN